MTTITWFTDSPDAGDPACICSWCGLPIGSDEAPPIRMFNSTVPPAGVEARFHRFCHHLAVTQLAPPPPSFPSLRTLPYVAPLGLPLAWRDEQSGVLPAAIKAYFDAALGRDTITADQLVLLINYLIYYINAPCWKGEGLEALRLRVGELRTRADVDDFLDQCLEIGLDPL